MGLATWMFERGLLPDRDAVLAAVSSDGLRIRQDHIMSVSLVRGNKLLVLYVKGADAEKCEKHTRTPPSFYALHSMAKEEAVEKAAAFCKDCRGLVTYRAGEYTIPWMSLHFDPGLASLPALDINHVIPVLDARLEPPREKGGFGGLARWFEGEAENLPGTSFKNLTAVYCPSGLEELPVARARPAQLAALWRTALRKG